MTKPKMCKAKATAFGKVDFISPSAKSTDLDSIIKEDVKYGKFEPWNGKYFTYRVTNEDDEISNKQVLKAIQYSFRRISLRTNLKFRRARGSEYADLTIEFRTVDTDPEKQLTKNTLMYHYYPISNFEDPLRGLCVINKDFYWTSHGKGIDMHYIDPKNYPKLGSGVKGKTWDLDQVYTHEVLHGLGLPHSKNQGNVMSPNYSIMSEWMTQEDIARIQAKYGKREMSDHILKRWLRWLFRASDRI
jgi:hypothetical protein